MGAEARAATESPMDTAAKLPIDSTARVYTDEEIAAYLDATLYAPTEASVAMAVSDYVAANAAGESYTGGTLILTGDAAPVPDTVFTGESLALWQGYRTMSVFPGMEPLLRIGDAVTSGGAATGRFLIGHKVDIAILGVSVFAPEASLYFGVRLGVAVGDAAKTFPRLAGCLQSGRQQWSASPGSPTSLRVIAALGACLGGGSGK